MSPSSPGRYRIALAEVRPDGTTRQLIDGTCSAYILAITRDPEHGELRVLTDHYGPADQREGQPSRASRPISAQPSASSANSLQLS